MTTCPSCGARLDAPPAAAAYVHACHYCGTQVTIEPLAPPEPAPRIEIIEVVAPNVDARVASLRNASRVSRSSGSAVGCFVLFMAALPVLIIFGPKIKGLLSSQFGSFPISVGMNDSLEIDDRTATLDEPLVTVGINGKVTLRRCHLKGPMIVKAGVNAQITIVDSELEGTRGILDLDGPNVVLTIENSKITSAEEIVEDGSVNTKVIISKASKLKAAGMAFPLTGNGEISIDNSTVEGTMGGIEMKNNGRVKLTAGADVKSDGVAIDLETNGHLQVTSSKVESKTTAVRAISHLEGTLRNATLIGPKAALDVGQGARLTVAQSNLSGPRIVPKSSTVEDR